MDDIWSEESNKQLTYLTESPFLFDWDIFGKKWSPLLTASGNAEYASSSLEAVLTPPSCDDCKN